MNRTELTVLVASTFMIAILIGWVLRWLFSRINRSGLGGGHSNDLAARLHASEEARDKAYSERDATVKDVQNRLAQTEAELSAAMEGLGNARREADDLRRQIAELRS